MSGCGTFLVDFDGTISTVDVGNAFFRMATQGAWEQVVDSWKAGSMGSRECLITESALARCDRDAFLQFAAAQPVDPGFSKFLTWAESLGWAVRVVSDGLELYIRAILDREGLGRVPVEANQVVFAGTRILPSFPFAGRGCGLCGNCKRGAVEEALSRGPVWFVGDGMSDRCAAHAATKVFAKNGKALAEFCRREKLPHLSFETFEDLLSLARREMHAAQPTNI